MVNQQYIDMLSAKSVIRELSEVATKLSKELGKENVYDFTLGNPSIDVPDEYNQAIIEMHQNMDSISLHGYTPSATSLRARSRVGASINNRFGMSYSENHIFMTAGAASAIAHAIRAVTVPGETVIVIAPFFPEYRPYIEATGAKIKVVPSRTEDFQIDFDALEEAIDENVAAIMINSPNNPTGVAYSKETIKQLAGLLKLKQKEYNNDIFIISDEPYREIMFDGKEYVYTAKYYPNTITCYSFSKSLSIPGERIGYVAVNSEASHADLICPMMTQISRGIGHNCPSSSVQLAASQCCDITADTSVYETNMNLFYDAFVELGFDVVRPDGTFYIFPKALEEDAVEFCKKAAKYNLFFVPSDGFGIKGYFRVAYCVDTEKVKKSIGVLRQFVEENYGNN